MLVPAGAVFDADRIIEMALRQDIGPDPSMSALRSKLKMVDPNNLTEAAWEYKKKYRDMDPLMQAENHFADYNFMEKQQRLEKFELEKPATFINRPLTRAQIRRRLMRSVGKQEIEFRNGALICKFLNDSGKLYNRYQTRLSTVVHRRVAKTVKKMRHLGLIPFVGVLKPTDKIPLGNFIDEVEEMHKKTIDPVTGRMYLRHSLQDDARDKARRAAKKVDSRTSDFGDYETKEDEEMAKVRLEAIREMSLESNNFVPNRAQREWMMAQAILLKQTNVFVSLFCVL